MGSCQFAVGYRGTCRMLGGPSGWLPVRHVDKAEKTHRVRRAGKQLGARVIVSTVSMSMPDYGWCFSRGSLLEA